MYLKGICMVKTLAILFTLKRPSPSVHFVNVSLGFLLG